MLQIKRYNKTRQTDEAVLSLQDIPEGAIVHRELMGDHYIKLPFSYDEPVYLNVGDWCEIVGYGRFELTEPYSPKYNTETGGYDYELQLNAHYKKWKNKICKYMPSSGGKETSFDLTASLGVHLAVIIENITALGAKDSSFKYRVDENTLVNFSADIDAAHVDSTAAKHKRYENTDIISALDDLADIYDCEWWVDDNIIRFGRLEIEGEPTPFNVDVEDANVENNVSSISSTESKKEYANRLYVFGSDRNIPKNYRPVQGADITVNGVVQKRLMLPEELPEELPEGFEVPEGVILGSGYIQDGELEESEVVEAVMIDDDIYPRTKCHISRIETYTKTYTDEETNRQVTQTFYRLYDDSGFRFSNSIRLEREELRILFVSGSMNGMDFECIYNDKNKYYEVVVNDYYGRELPDTDLHPSIGDYFVIYGWDSTKMASTGLIADAELELYQSAVKKLAKLKIDPNVYTCKMDSEWYERERRVSGVSYAHFDLGQKVLLNSRAVSVEGRESRIIGFEFKLDIPYDSPEYIVGEAIAYSRSSDMQSQIDAITVNGSSYHVTGSGGGSGIFVISSTSKVQSSDTNVYSAKRTDFDFLHKREPDTAHEEIGFLKGIWIKLKGLFGFTENGDLTARTLTATGTKGNTIADIDNTTRKNLGLEVSESGIIGGILRVAKSIMTKTIQSLNFTGGDSLFGTGWQLTDNDGNGNSRLVVDNLFVRMKAVFNELEVRKFVAMGGNYVFSPAASIIEEVDYIGLDENDNEVVLGYEYVKVPWVLRLVPLSLIGKILSKKKMVRSTMSSSDFANVVKFRCWLRSDDGTTRTINTWRVGMLARCQTFNVSQGSGTHEDTWYGKNISNKLYWRAVTAVGEAVTSQSYSMPNHILDDGLKHNYIDLANYTDENNVQLYLTGSDNPEALDNIVCYGDWLDRTLSNLISIETVGSEAPCIREMLEVGYTNGQSIDWSLTNKERTRISPTAGNKFVAPSFVVTTEGSADESLYVERYKGTAFKTQFVQGMEVAMAPDGSIVLLAYSDIEVQNALKTLHIIPPSVDNPAYGFVWESSKARLGDAYVCQADGHRYVATKTGWEDRGLNDESQSTLKVDINGILLRVAGVESAASNLESELLLKAGTADLLALVDNLEAAGVHISGVDKLIKLVAEKAFFVTPDGKAMIAVQMCNEQGQIDANGTIPSIVFYDGEIGNGGTVRWILNYKGFLKAINTGERYDFDEYTLNWLGNHSVASGMDEESVIHAEAFAQCPYLTGTGQDLDTFYDEDLEENVSYASAYPKASGTGYRFKSAYHMSLEDVKVYDPANGEYKENRFWDSDEVDEVDEGSWLPLGEDADGFYIIPDAYDKENIEAFQVFDGTKDPSLPSGPSHANPIQLDFQQMTEFGYLPPSTDFRVANDYQIGANPVTPGVGDLIRVIPHDDKYILLEVKNGYVISRHCFYVHYLTQFNETTGKLNFIIKEWDNGGWKRSSYIIVPQNNETSLQTSLLDNSVLISSFVTPRAIIDYQDALIEEGENPEDPNGGEEEPSYYDETGNWDD